MPAKPPVAVLLVHGLWRTPLCFLSLARRLERLAADGRPYAVIGHSLGGVLLGAALRGLVGTPPAHLVMLGTPNRPPRLAGRLCAHWGYRRLMGECGVNLSRADFYTTLAGPPVPYTLVAGTAGPRGRWSPFGDELNDGIVAVSETRVCDADAPVLLPVTHTFMMSSERVQAVIRETLETVSAAR